mgnify:CR=1 FL=1
MGAEVIIFVALFASVFGIGYLYFTTRHKERMSLIDKGADASIFEMGARRTYWAVKIAFLAMGIGVGIFIGSVLEQFTRLDEEVAYFSMICLCGGLGLLGGFFLGRSLLKKDEKKD